MGQSVNKIKTRKKRRMGADELNAYRIAYEKPLTKKNYLFYIGLPAIVLGGFLFYLTYVWYITLFAIIVGAVYGWQVLLTKSVMRNYQILAYNERNRMLNLLTQQLTDNTKIPKEILVRVVSRLDGELKQDFSLITAKIANGATNYQIKELFKVINDKYAFDIIFCQYIEQLETNFTTGIDNIDSLKDMTIYHNDLREKRDSFLRFKNNFLKDCRLLIIIFLIFITAIEFSFGWDRFKVAFADNWMGQLISILYVLLFAIIMRSFFKRYFDDSIMEIGVK